MSPCLFDKNTGLFSFFDYFIDIGGIKKMRKCLLFILLGSMVFFSACTKYIDEKNQMTESTGITDITETAETTETTETTKTKQTLGEWMINRINKEDEGKIATNRLEQIIEAINIRDKDIIKEMFSEQAISEAEDLDGGVNYLFTLIDEKILSWDKIGGSVDESIDEGRTTTMYWYRFNINTENEQYLISISEYTKDDENPKNIGLYSIKVINVEDEEPKFSEPGIYVKP